MNLKLIGPYKLLLEEVRGQSVANGGVGGKVSCWFLNIKLCLENGCVDLMGRKLDLEEGTWFRRYRVDD